MEKKESAFKERINYIVTHHNDGRTSYTGKSTNYDNVVCSSWKSPEDLEKKMNAMLHMYLEFHKEELEKNGVEMVEVNEEEWYALGDNITYWEMLRVQRIIKRPEVQESWQKIIASIILMGEDEDLAPGYIAENIIQALINDQTKY